MMDYKTLEGETDPLLLSTATETLTKTITSSLRKAVVTLANTLISHILFYADSALPVTYDHVFL